MSDLKYRLILSFFVFIFLVLQVVCEDEATEPEQESISHERFERLLRVHAMIAALAWGLFAPVAIMASAFRRVLPWKLEASGWFNIHWGMNILVYVLTLISFFIAVYALQKEDGPKHFPFEEPEDGVARGHRAFGLILIVLMTSQLLSGIFRPEKPEPTKMTYDHEENGETGMVSVKKSRARLVWEYGHRIFGVLLMICSVYQVLSGLILYAEEGFSSAWYHTISWVYVFSLVCPLLVLVLIRNRE